MSKSALRAGHPLPAIVLALSALAIPASRAAAEDNPAVIYQQTLKGTVYIKVDHGSGSGWVVDLEKRLVVTNHHVIDRAREIRVYFPKFQDGELVTSPGDYADSGDGGVRAKVLLSDPKKDLAVLELKVLPKEAVALKLAGKSPSPGERLHALGNPGVSGSLWVYSAGSVRTVYRQQLRDGKMRFDAWVVESTLPTNPGDSGGPEVNDQGELIGVTSHHRTDGRLVTHGIDVREVKAVLKDVLAGERGVRGQPAAGDDDEDEPAPPKKKARPGGDDEDDPPAASPGKGDVKSLLAKAVRLMKAQQLDEALEVLAKVLRLDPENVEALTKRAWIFNEQGNYGAAAREAGKAIQIDPESTDGYRERGFARLKKKQYEEAVKDLTRAIKLNPKDAHCYVYRAKAYQALGEDDRADADLAKAKRLGYRDGAASED